MIETQLVQDSRGGRQRSSAVQFSCSGLGFLYFDCGSDSRLLQASSEIVSLFLV